MMFFFSSYARALNSVSAPTMTVRSLPPSANTFGGGGMTESPELLPAFVLCEVVVVVPASKSGEELPPPSEDPPTFAVPGVGAAVTHPFVVFCAVCFVTLSPPTPCQFSPPTTVSTMVPPTFLSKSVSPKLLSEPAYITPAAEPGTVSSLVRSKRKNPPAETVPESTMLGEPSCATSVHSSRETPDEPVL